MAEPRIVIDTSVWVAALRSRQGASYRLLGLLGQQKYRMVISVALILEYESTALRLPDELRLSHADIDDLLDYVCKVGSHQQISYLWRPVLNDPDDDMVLELAANGRCQYIVTFNIRDFGGVEKFGVSAVTPQEFLRIIGEIS